MNKKIWEELENIRSQINQDIEVYFRCADSGGYFAVPQLVLSLVDYLGALATGEARIVGRTSDNAVLFIKTFFPFQYYFKSGLIYQALRHGITHERRPKHPTLFKLGPVAWLLEKDPAFRKQHLTPLKDLNGEKINVLIINLPELVNDLKLAIDQFENELRTNAILRKYFLHSLKLFLKPESEKELKNKSYIDPSEFKALRDLFKR